MLLFLTISPIVALGGSMWWIATGRVHPETLLLAAGMAMLTGLGITAGYHRLFAHRSYSARAPVRLVLLLAGAAGIEESAWSWCRDHRRHHRFIDRDGDPHDIRRGFWHAHLLWMFRKDAWRGGDPGAGDLWKDPLVRLQHRFYLPLAILMGFFLPAAIALLWGDLWGGLLIAGLVRIVVNHHCTFAINSICHTFGSQPYSDRHSARDNWVTALLTYGEGYHNFHHEFPSDYRNGVKPSAWDPSKWLIVLLWRLRLASDLRTADRETIAYRKVLMQEKRLAQALRSRADAGAGTTGPRLAHARQRVGAACVYVRALQRRRHVLRGSMPAQLQAIDAQLHRASAEFEDALAHWYATVRSLGLRGAA